MKVFLLQIAFLVLFLGFLVFQMNLDNNCHRNYENHDGGYRGEIRLRTLKTPQITCIRSF